jgi:hypothetical protein
MASVSSTMATASGLGYISVSSNATGVGWQRPSTCSLPLQIDNRAPLPIQEDIAMIDADLRDLRNEARGVVFSIWVGVGEKAEGPFSPMERTDYTSSIALFLSGNASTQSYGPETTQGAWYALPSGYSALVKVSPLERPANTGRYFRVTVAFRTFTGDFGSFTTEPRYIMSRCGVQTSILKALVDDAATDARKVGQRWVGLTPTVGSSTPTLQTLAALLWRASCTASVRKIGGKPLAGKRSRAASRKGAQRDASADSDSDDSDEADCFPDDTPGLRKRGAASGASSTLATPPAACHAAPSKPHRMGAAAPAPALACRRPVRKAATDASKAVAAMLHDLDSEESRSSPLCPTLDSVAATDSTGDAAKVVTAAAAPHHWHDAHDSDARILPIMCDTDTDMMATGNAETLITSAPALANEASYQQAVDLSKVALAYTVQTRSLQIRRHSSASLLQLPAQLLPEAPPMLERSLTSEALAAFAGYAATATNGMAADVGALPNVLLMSSPALRGVGLHLPPSNPLLLQRGISNGSTLSFFGSPFDGGHASCLPGPLTSISI